MLVAGEAALVCQQRQCADHDAEGHAVLVHGGVLHAADTRYQRGIELGDGQDVIQRCAVKTINAACASRHAHCAEGAAGVGILVVVHDGLAHADGGLIGDVQRCQEVLSIQITLIACRQQTADKGGAGVGTDDVMAVIDVIGVGGVPHGSGGPQKIEGIRCADDGDVTGAEGAASQSQTGGKLTATAAGDQRTQQIQHTTPQPFLHGSGNVRPLGLQNKVFQSVISGKIHGHFLSAALGRSTI